MSHLDDLRRIADAVGIATRHVDALGVWREPGEEILSRLITAFGLPSDPLAAAEALAEEGRAAPFGLAPVQIVGAEAPAVLPLRLPAGTSVDYVCQFEGGGEHSERSDGAELHLPQGLPLGYHRLGIEGGGDAEIDLVVAPDTCHLGPGLEWGARSWGLTAQLYGLRRAGDWGIGDFTDLATLCREAGKLGAAAVGINPLHALFAAEPRHFSPYSPSSRNWLDYLYIDPAAVPGFAEEAAAAPGPAAELVDYGAVAARKRPLLEALFRRWRDRGGGRLAGEFRAFRRDGGPALAEFATFEALHEHFTQAGGPFSWHRWPAALRNPNSRAVGEFARAHAARVEFFQFLQWLADRQLAAAAAAGQTSGLAIGLYRDLAVGVNPNGADAWADQELVIPGMAIGAPPDLLNQLGQNWGLAPINPLALRRRGFAPLIAALRANMRHAGVLRIDHAMGLQRLYWVPSGAPATEGAYVNHPFHDLLRLVALESRRHGCAVIGEDLGTVPDGFREVMRRANVLSYRVFVFERHGDASFVAPHDYPALAAAAAATHDLATLKGFWLGNDIAWRQRLGLYPNETAEATELADRRRDRRLLLEALIREGLIAPERFAEFLPEEDRPVYAAELSEAIHTYLARSKARLMLVQLQDIAGEGEQANVPGTTDAHPNWRRRLAATIEELCAGPEMARLAALVSEARRSTAPE